MTDKQAMWLCCLTAILWMPALVLGLLGGMLWFGFKGGWAIHETLDGAMDQSNAAESRKQVEVKR